MSRSILFIALAFTPLAARATCDAGYYLSADECAPCDKGYYCPGDNTRISCPADTTDWAAEYTALGYTVINVHHDSLWSAIPRSKISDCYITLHITVTGGKFLVEPCFYGTRYASGAKPHWFVADNGYYLSSYFITSYKDWYRGVKQCTNAPTNAHYTGPGTPDAPDGSITDANDCPWECDAGYGRHDTECVPLCTAGIKYIKTETGLRFNLYPVKYSSPAIAVQYNNEICYANLAPDAAKHTINLEFNGRIFHMVN